MSPAIDTISATIVEKDLIKVTFIEKEIISVKFTVIDIVNYLEKTVVSGLIREIPVKLSSVRFQTSKPYTPGSIKFILNGICEAKADLTEISTTIFEISEAILSDDDYETEFLELL